MWYVFKAIGLLTKAFKGLSYYEAILESQEI